MSDGLERPWISLVQNHRESPGKVADVILPKTVATLCGYRSGIVYRPWRWEIRLAAARCAADDVSVVLDVDTFHWPAATTAETANSAGSRNYTTHKPHSLDKSPPDFDWRHLIAKPSTRCWSGKNAIGGIRWPIP